MTGAQDPAADGDELHAQPVPFEYALLRVVPRMDRGEFLNTGVVLYCQARDFLRCRGTLDHGRIAALHPGLDLGTLEAALRSVCAICDGDPSAGLAAGESLRSRFGWLTAPRSTMLQAGPVHSGLTLDPAADLDSLHRQLVDLPTA